jgi:metal-responsive CopG/Arc/MetJ family transcriptional regulator
MGKEAIVAVRLADEEIEKIDRHTEGELSRSQIVRILIQDFIEKSDEDQRQFLVARLFRN